MAGGDLNCAGRPEEAIGLIEKAMRLNPHYPPFYLFFLGEAYRLTGRYEEAIAAYKRALTRNPDFLPAHLTWLPSTVSWAGRRRPGRRWQKSCGSSPKFSLEVLRQRLAL